MTHMCEDCGETFETLSRLRLHECSADATDATGDTTADDRRTEESMVRQQSRQRDRERRARRTTGDTLDEALEQAHDGDPGAAVTALAHLERELERVQKRYDSDRFRDVFWGYYQTTVEAVDSVARREGWPFRLEIAAAYDPHEEGMLPEISGVVANLVARGVVRTRLSDGIESIPVAALEYLASIPVFHTESFEIAWEESMHYGWGIGHPDVPVADTIRDRIDFENDWAQAAAARALYADQHAAVSLYCDVLRAGDEESRLFAADRLSHFEGDPHWETFPRGWDIGAEFERDFAFTFDDSVERQLRATIEGVGIVDHFGDDWTFEDLELYWE